MKYETRKSQIRLQIESKFQKTLHESAIFVDVITEKIAAEEFNKFFYQGEGVTNSEGAQSSIRLTKIYFVKAFLRGIGASIYAVFLVTFLKTKTKSANSLGWVYAIPPNTFEHLDGVENLEKYLDSKIISLNLKVPNEYLVQSGSLSGKRQFGRIRVVPHISSELLRIEQTYRLIQIFKIFIRTVSWLQKSLSNPYLFLIGPEYIVDFLAVRQRTDRERDLLVTTQSQLLAPAYVFKSEIKAERIMFWYSDNSMQISKHPIKDFDYSYLSQPAIDIHFVWTPSWKRKLSVYNERARVIPSGPVIFRIVEKPNETPYKQSRQLKNVVIFDVTPKKSASIDSIYSEEIMRKFLSDIVEIVGRRHPTASLKLKPKRKYTRSDSVAYIHETSLLSPILKKMEWSCDIVELLLESDLVICAPFTSPALISSYLGIRTAFYVPSREFDFGQTHENIPVLQGRAELELFLDQFPY
jgi:polysaccharide biosynthesis PFTS motif protein